MAHWLNENFFPPITPFAEHLPSAWAPTATARANEAARNWRIDIPFPFSGPIRQTQVAEEPPAAVGLTFPDRQVSSRTLPGSSRFPRKLGIRVARRIRCVRFILTHVRRR